MSVKNRKSAKLKMGKKMNDAGESQPLACPAKSKWVGIRSGRRFEP
jgi:hypothetical protein